MVTRACSPGGGGRGDVDFGMAQGLVQEGRHFPGQAQDAEAVGAVGGDGNFKDGVGQAHGFGEIPAQGQVLGNLHETHVIGGQAQLIFRQEHAFGEDAPELGGLELVTAGQDGPGRGKGVENPGGDVGGAAHHPIGLTAGGHLGHLQPVRLGVAFDVQDLAHDHPGKFRDHSFHGLDFKAGHGESIRQGLSLKGEVHKISQPVERQSHNKLI